MTAETGNSRATAALIVHQVIFRGQQLNRTLDRALNRWDAENRPLIAEMVNGVVRWFWLLEFYLEQLLERPMRRKDYDLVCLLCVGIYQLEFMRIPQHASVSETVNATAKMGKSWARGLVNAILRKFLRNRGQLDLADLNEVARFSHPQWLLDLLRKEWPNEWQTILNANNRKPRMTLRVNIQKTNAADYCLRLKSMGIAASFDCDSPVAIQLEERVRVDKLPGFAHGEVSVQSSASQLASLSMELAPGQRVLDACSAPGGKLLHMLEIEPQLDEIIAIEIDEVRKGEIVDNLQRARMAVKVLTADASRPADWWDGEPFDRILIDAPCSALGVVSKHPDIKHHRRLDDIEQVARQQTQLLNALLPLLKSNGKLLYTTCSILAQENDCQIENVLTSHADLVSEPLPPVLGQPTRFGRQRLQNEQGGDGFYYAKISRR